MKKREIEVNSHKVDVIDNHNLVVLKRLNLKIEKGTKLCVVTKGIKNGLVMEKAILGELKKTEGIIVRKGKVAKLKN